MEIPEPWNRDRSLCCVTAQRVLIINRKINSIAFNIFPFKLSLVFDDFRDLV
jgi:hypothetical protein